MTQALDGTQCEQYHRSQLVQCLPYSDSEGPGRTRTAGRTDEERDVGGGPGTGRLKD